ncbi:hypothetical protein TIFTF001_011072 [Ficus carica]|uniref:Pentatricopeptide repeat-containing protein n=1 Tax=Ficus carica TaxID=3494 RepID=A0AA87ZZA3_FICCA|nr:hypothetical protein TIFTF001_011072 [Ficus carica]
MDHAHHMFDPIPQPDILVFNTMARGYSRSETPIQAVMLFAETLSTRILPNDYPFPSLLKACASSKAFEEGKQLHSLAFKWAQPPRLRVSFSDKHVYHIFWT